MSRTVSFLDMEFDAVTMVEGLAWIATRSRSKSFSYLVTPNVDHIVQIHDPLRLDARPAFANADLIVCDSRILSLFALFSGLRLPVLPGSDLTRELLDSCADGTRLAIVGGDKQLVASMRDRYPRYEWMAHHPPMGVRANACARREIAEFIYASSAEIILFAIGAPQSEIACREIQLSGRARGTALCIGASLEFLTGAKKRAPRWMQCLALEWLFRLINEPNRLWRRYLLVGPRVFIIWWNWILLRRARLRV